jgi:hypothetical protein
MKRRDVLKNMGLGLGYAVATPTIISLLQSCQGEAATGYQAVLFSQDEFGVLTTMVDVILPKTDTPSASEVNVPMFIDKYISETQTEDGHERAQKGMAAFIAVALEKSGKSSASKLNAEDVEAVLAATLKADTSDAEGDLKAAAGFASQMRGMAINAYKNSEYVGENVLAYLPIPGEYIATGDLQELTGGKAWSL